MVAKAANMEKMEVNHQCQNDGSEFVIKKRPRNASPFFPVHYLQSFAQQAASFLYVSFCMLQVYSILSKLIMNHQQGLTYLLHDAMCLKTKRNRGSWPCLRELQFTSP